LHRELFSIDIFSFDKIVVAETNLIYHLYHGKNGPAQKALDDFEFCANGNTPSHEALIANA